MLLLILCFMVHCLWGFCAWSLFCYALLSVLSSFCNHLHEEKRPGFFGLIVFLIFCDCRCFFIVLKVGLQGVNLVFLDHTHLHFGTGVQ